MYHGHILRQDDRGLMSRFIVVVGLDQAATAPTTIDAHAP